ncbi:MAG: hypothetical protein IT363_13465 [Methanoregulaceae archaeon]|nr:hypothetical protein [Methanoregulaceae archaeon]
MKLMIACLGIALLVGCGPKPAPKSMLGAWIAPSYRMVITETGFLYVGERPIDMWKVFRYRYHDGTMEIGALGEEGEFGGYTSTHTLNFFETKGSLQMTPAIDNTSESWSRAKVTVDFSKQAPWRYHFLDDDPATKLKL